MALLPDKEKLLRNFLRCANWEEKYLYIIELGQRLPELRAEDRSPQNSIQGCQSQVWIVMRQNAQGIIELQGDSDAGILSISMCVRGLKKWRSPNISPHLVHKVWKR